MKPYLLLALALWPHLGHAVDLTVSEDYLGAAYQGTDALHGGATVLTTIEASHGFSGGMHLLVKAGLTTAGPQFSYSTTMDTFDGIHYFAPQTFAERFTVGFQYAEAGMGFEHVLGPADAVGAEMGIGMGWFEAMFTDAGTETYSGRNTVADTTWYWHHKWRGFTLGLSGGYLWAQAPEDGMTADADYAAAGYSAHRGQTMPGPLDFSGFKAGIQIGVPL